MAKKVKKQETHWNRPRRTLLTVWRLFLTLIALAPALLCALLFQVGGVPWLIATGIWVICFLFFYLFYLPVRYHRLAWYLTEESLVLRSGVFYNRLTTIPLGSVQFVVVRSDPVGQFLHLRTLVALAPGGRVRIPGMSPRDATVLADVLL